MGTLGDFGQIALKWDPKNLEIRTMSVEKTLEPLVLQVTTLVNTKGPSKKKKGKRRERMEFALLSMIHSKQKCHAVLYSFYSFFKGNFKTFSHVS